jgi:hypothetical protein
LSIRWCVILSEVTGIVDTLWNFMLSMRLTQQVRGRIALIHIWGLQEYNLVGLATYFVWARSFLTLHTKFKYVPSHSTLKKYEEINEPTVCGHSEMWKKMTVITFSFCSKLSRKKLRKYTIKRRKHHLLSGFEPRTLTM